MQSQIRVLVVSAMFIALIFVSAYSLSVSNGIGGVIHLGDALIFLAAAILPKPHSLVVAALGLGIFNLASPLGLAMWFPFTITIKPLMALCFTNKGETVLGPIRNRIAPFIAMVINTVLYFGANVLITEAGGLAALPGLLIQGAGSVVFFFVIAFALDVAGVKKLLRL